MAHVYVFNPQINLVSATRLAGESDIKAILGLAHIPAAMKPLLRQPVIPSEALNPLVRFKKRLRDYLLRHATRDAFFGWIIDPSMKEAIVAEIEQLREQFYEEKETLLAKYDGHCVRHLDVLAEACRKEGVANCERFVAAIRAAQPTEAYLRARLQFSYLRPRLIELDPGEIEIVREGVYGQAMHEVAQRARDGALCQQPRARRRALAEVCTKLAGLAYIDPRLRLVSEGIAEVLADIPESQVNAEYTPVQRLAIDSALATLSNPATLQARVAAGSGLFDRPEADDQPEDAATAAGDGDPAPEPASAPGPAGAPSATEPAYSYGW